MLSKTSKKKAAVTLPSIPKAVIDRMVSGPMTAEAINATSMAFKKALIERALGAELSHHLGFLPGTDKLVGSANHRGKTVLTDDGPQRIDVPRDRSGSFEPLLIPKHERRFTGFDDKIVALYARGMTRREIQGVLVEQYGTEVSPELIRSVTDAVMAEVTVWQVRPWEPMSPVVFFDCLRVKIREDAVVHNKAIDLALGILPDGTRDILGLWIENTEGQVLDEGLQRPQDPWRGRHPDCRHGRSERHGRGAGGGVSGDEAANLHRASHPQPPRRRQLEGPQGTGVSDQADRHRAEAAQAELDSFAAGPWGIKFPTVAAAWRRVWDRVIPFFAFPRPFAR
jgi:transposase-like protein